MSPRAPCECQNDQTEQLTVCYNGFHTHTAPNLINTQSTFRVPDVQELSKKYVAQTIRFLGFSDATFNKYLFEQLTASLRHQVCHRQLKAIIAGSALQEVKAQSLDDDDVQLLAKERSWGPWGENLRFCVGWKKEGEKQLIWR